MIPLLGSCQKKYNAPPFNDYETKIRKLPQETERIIIRIFLTVFYPLYSH